MITTIDVGATKTLIAQFDEKSQPINQVRFLTPKSIDDFLVELHKNLNSFTDISAISMGLPGRFNDKGDTVIACGNLDWCNVPLKDILSKTYNCPIFIENDANLAALSEINQLSPVPRLGVYITVSTGIGSGIVINGKLLPELKSSEAGHMAFRTKEGWQKWEDLASGRAIKDHFGKLAQDLHNPDELSWIADELSPGLVCLIPLLQPDVIVFGGGVGKYFDRFGELLKEKIRQQMPTYIEMPSLKGALHAEEAVLYGCYYYAKNQQAN